MIKKTTLFAAVAATLAIGMNIKVPVAPHATRLQDPYYHSLVHRTAVTPTGVNSAAREYLSTIAVPETLRVLAIRVEFPEDDDSTTWGSGKMDLAGFGTPADGLEYDPPHDKTYFENQMLGLRNYYLANSRGRLVVEYDVYPSAATGAYRVPHKMAYYGDTANPDRGLTLFMRDALLAAAKDPEIDFSRYHYSNGVQTFDMIVIFHAGSTSQSSFWYGYTGDLPSATVTPGALEAYTGLPYVEAGGVQFATASILPESPRVEQAMAGLPGILYHEFGHLLGAYDLYNVTGYTQGVGAWALMGGGGWLGYPPGQIPSMHDAFHRDLFGWEDAITVTQDTTVALYASEFDTLLNPDWEAGKRPTLIKIPIRDKEYFLIENRQADVQGIKVDSLDTVTVDVEDGVPIWVDRGEYDAFQPGSGMIIWHVDEDVVDLYGPSNLLNVWTPFGQHNAVKMMEADGIPDYEILFATTGSSATQGTAFDPFFTEKRDGSSVGNSLLARGTKPSSAGYYGSSNIEVKILDVSDTLMRVRVSFDGKLEGFPKVASSVKEINSAYAIDLDSDGEKELLSAGVVTSNVSYLNAWLKDGSVFGNSPYISFFDSLAAPVALGDVDGDGEDEIVTLGYRGRLSVYDSLDAPNPPQRVGFPFTLDGRSFAAPMLADLDSDGDLEILAADELGKVYAVNVTTDSAVLLAGYPVDLGEEVRSGFALYDESGDFAVLTTSGKLYLLNAQGEIKSGFPLELGKGSGQCDVPPVVADLDGDGEREIAVFVYEYERYRYAAVSGEGEVKYRSSRTFPSTMTAPALADINSDGLAEILFGAGNGLWALSANGSACSGYPVVFAETYKVQEPYVHGGYLYFITFDDPFFFTSSPVVGDFTGDGAMEIAMGSPDHGVYLVNPAGVYDTLYTRFGIDKGLSLADLDLDGNLEILAGADSGSVHVWKTAGTQLAWSGWMGNPRHTGLMTESFSAPPSTSVITECYVYPNPAASHAYLRLGLGDVDALRVDLLDISGRLLSTIQPEFTPSMANDIPLDDALAVLSPGLYIVRVEASHSGEKTVKLYKLGIAR